MTTFRFRKAGWVEDFASGGSDTDDGITHVDFSNDLKANVVTSQYLLDPNRHLPVIDLDFDAHLEPSSTPGHHHLYLDRALTWENYLKLLAVMAEVGLIEWGYYEASKKRGYTTVRLPWVTKEITNDIPADPVVLPRWVRSTLNLPVKPVA